MRFIVAFAFYLGIAVILSAGASVKKCSTRDLPGTPDTTPGTTTNPGNASAAVQPSNITPLPANDSSVSSNDTAGSGSIKAVPGVDVKVKGSILVDADGKEFRFRGANLQGSEYQCIMGSGYSQGTVDQKEVDGLLTWGINGVRIPLNEDCLLSTKIPGVIESKDKPYIGPKYMEALKNQVELMLKNKMVVILDLHWTHGDSGATKQYPMTDQYAPLFWETIAKTFSVPGVIFDLYNEPIDISWDCWLKGGASCTAADKTQGYNVSGMQTLIDAVRKTGSKNPILLQGIHWGSDLTGISTHTPVDPAKQLILGFHTYDFAGCNTSECRYKQDWSLMKEYPVLIGELGQKHCQHDFVDQVMEEADKVKNSGYLAWAWFAEGDCSEGPTVISSYDGTPNGLGEGFKAHYLKLAGAAGNSTSYSSNTTASIPTTVVDPTGGGGNTTTIKTNTKKSKHP